MSSFISAHKLVETNTISNTSNEYEDNNRTEDNIQQYIRKSKIQNTNACTQKWVVDEKCMELQDQEYGKTDQLKGLTKEEIQQILLYLNSGNQTALRLTQKAFFWNAYLLGLRGGDHYQLLLSCFDFQSNRGLIFTIGCEKNNQGELQANIMNDIAQASKINITDQHITNYSGRRTAIQLLSDLNINEHSSSFNPRRISNSFQVPTQEEETQILIQEEPQVPTQKKSHVLMQNEFQAPMQYKNIQVKKKPPRLTKEEV
ncbi:32245_t:CDS:2 [Gigaspora margarita]|uniref:32245_t:CDS:1 n=1 Tax=Gigaspora margarita TaxID=4874 RepID=A0ABN7URW3_GIGMA|nr:32245_t:CDS:2 [Gigaspora margarita]